jgi:hypothetical protein
MITVEGPCTSTDFLSELVGKPIEVLLVNRQEGHRSDRQSGILTRVYSDAILLCRAQSEQLILIYLHAVAMIQQTSSGEEPFQTKIAIVPGSPATSSAGSSRNDLPAKYIGE